jgi:predicted dehydrogenase
MLTAAVIGCGPRGLEHARAFLALDGIALVGAAELNRDRREAAAAELRVAVYATASALLAQSLPEIVVLATPLAGRKPLADEVVRCPGVRALVVETPMAQSLVEAHRLVDSSEAAGIRLIVGHPLRFCQEFTALTDAVAAGHLGQIEWLRGVSFGSLLDQGPHLLDIICWLAGHYRPQWVVSQSCGDHDLLSRHAPHVTHRDGAARAAPPRMVHQIGFEGGLLATLETGTMHCGSGVVVNDPPQQRIIAIGSEGMAEAKSAGYYRILADRRDPEQIEGSLAGYQSATRRLHEELRDALVSGGAHRNDWHDTLRSFELLLACAESAVDGSRATFPLDPNRDSLSMLALTAQNRVGPRSRPAAMPPEPQPANLRARLSRA